MSRVLTYVEIDVQVCQLAYGATNGNGTCPAVLGTDSDIKCFNTRATCPVLESFDPADVTLRFAIDTGYLPSNIECLPSITGVSITPATLSLGEDLGVRGTLNVTLRDHPHPDTGPGFDPYYAERGYDPWKQGSMWGKFRARQPWLRGRAIRLIRGRLGQTLDQMETRHYVIESTEGPRPDGTYTIIAKDPLKLADNDRALAPKPSNGYLVSAIDADDVSATLNPAGIGNLEYPSSGYVCIGGSEVCAFTRSSDVLTLTRAALGTTARAHDSEDRVQLVLRYAAQDPADIISDLLQTYANMPSGFVPLSTWQAETDAYLQRLYTANITEPTGVNDLITEIIQQAALAVWWDDISQSLKLRVLRNSTTEPERLDADRYCEGSLSAMDQPNKRVSQALTLFGQRDPTKGLSEDDNYAMGLLSLDEASEENYGGPAVKKIYARWIPQLGRSIAQRANNLLIGRYRNPPRRFGMQLFRDAAPPNLVMGAAYNIAGQMLQDATGAPATTKAVVTRIDPGDAILKLELEEEFAADLEVDDLFNRIITIDSNTFYFNLREQHDLLYPEIVDPYGITLTCVIAEGVIVGSSTDIGAGIDNPSFEVGSWPAGLAITLDVRGRIQGHGGRGNSPSLAGSNYIGGPGFRGGPALRTRCPIAIKGAGEIFGGGGGGSGASVYNGGGGGGAGSVPGQGGYTIFFEGVGPQAPSGTQDAGGAGVNGSGAGGDPGEAGHVGSSGHAGGAAGAGIDGISYVTDTEWTGDIRGPQIN